jgi:acetyl esterase/lipase
LRVIIAIGYHLSPMRGAAHDQAFRKSLAKGPSVISPIRHSIFGVIAAGAILATLAPPLRAGVAAQNTYTELLARPRPAATARIHYGDLPGQFSDLWLPSGAGPFRVVVLIHGGCWRADLPGLDLMTYAANDLRGRGLAVWNIEYRRLGESGGGYPGTFQDVAAAIDRLRMLAKTYPLDLGHVEVAGHSSGGHLALWAAARGRLPKSSVLHRGHPLAIARVVSLAGIGDLNAYRQFGHGACGEPQVIDRLVATATRGPWDNFSDTSPAALLPLGVPQAVVSGALDQIVPWPFGRTYAARAAALGDTVREVTIDGAGHFDLIDPHSKAFETVRTIIMQSRK